MRTLFGMVHPTSRRAKRPFRRVVGSVVLVCAAASPAGALTLSDVCDPWGLLAPLHRVDLTAADVASDGRTFAVTNGSEIWRSTDGGCSWTTIYESPTNDPLVDDLNPGRIVSVAATSTSVHAVVLEPGLFGAAPVRISSWRAQDPIWQPPAAPPAPVAARAVTHCTGERLCRLLRARGGADTLYILMDEGSGTPSLWQSDDDARTWAPVLSGAVDLSSVDVTDDGAHGLLAVDSCRTLLRREGGLPAFTRVQLPLGDSEVALGAAAAGSTVAVAVGNDGCGTTPAIAILVSRDRGATFERHRLPDVGAFGAIAVDRTGTHVVVAHGASTATAFDGKRIRPMVMPNELAALDVRQMESLDERVAILTSDGVFIADPSDALTYEQRPPWYPGCTDVEVERRPMHGSLDVQGRRIELGLGDTAVLPVSGIVRDASLPVDVAILFDSSPSMGPAIENMSRSIRAAAVALLAAGYDAHVSLAEFNDLQYRPYVQRLPLGPITCRLVYELDHLRIRGGNEAHLLALHQTVTGSGWPEPFIPAGQGGGFRDDVERLVVHLTDEAVDRVMPNSPSFEETVSAFRDVEARHVGIRVLDAQEAPMPTAADEVRADLEDLSRATGSVAPAGGLDCDGDGAVDVAEGAPMACTFGGLGTRVRDADLGDLLVQIVAAAVDLGQARVRVEAPEGIRVLGADERVSVRKGGSARIADRLQVVCDRPAEGFLDVRLQLGDTVVASRTLPVTCAAAVPPVVPVDRADLLPPMPPPLVPTMLSVTQSVSSGQQVTATSGAFAPSRQREPMLAYAQQRRADPEPQPGFVLAAGAMTMVAAAIARRRRVQLAYDEER